MTGYNYAEFSSKSYDFSTFDGPSPGQKAPDLSVATLSLANLGGDPKRILDFDGDFLVLEMGSATCPLYQGRRAKMEPLQHLFPEMTFAVLYVREAHPGAIRCKHHDMGQKIDRAASLHTDDGESRDIWIDDIEGSVHAAFGSMPNSLFVLNRNGCVVYRNIWNSPGATQKALRAITNGKAPKQEGYFLPANPRLVLKVLKDGGKGSASDFFRGLPHLIVENLIKRNLRLFFGTSRNVAPDCRC